MALYYFDIQSRGEFHRDEFGDSFETLEQAAAQAEALLFDVVCDHPPGEGGRAVCEVRDDQGWVRYRAQLTFRSDRIVSNPSEKR